MMPPQWLVIGVSGITCGGKSTLALNLVEYFINNKNTRLWNSKYVIYDVQLINQDNYFLPVDDPRHTWEKRLNAINFEMLSSLNMQQMLTEIEWHLRGCTLSVQNALNGSADFVEDAAKFQQTVKLNVLVIEGFLIFNQPEIMDLCHLKFHFHLPYEKCFARRKTRTYEPPDVTGYFEMCVWPHYEQNFAKIRDQKDLILLNGDLPKDKIFKYVLQRISSFLNDVTNACWTER